MAQLIPNSPIVLSSGVDSLLGVNSDDFPRLDQRKAPCHYEESSKHYALIELSRNIDKDTNLSESDQKLSSLVFGNNPIQYCSNFYSNEKVLLYFITLLFFFLCVFLSFV